MATCPNSMDLKKDFQRIDHIIFHTKCYFGKRGISLFFWIVASFFSFPFLCPVYFMALLFLLLFLLTGSREKQVSSLGKKKTQQKIFGKIYIYIYMYIFTYVHMCVCLLLWCNGSEQGHVQPSLNTENVNIEGKTLHVKIQLVL